MVYFDQQATNSTVPNYIQSCYDCLLLSKVYVILGRIINQTYTSTSSFPNINYPYLTKVNLYQNLSFANHKSIKIFLYHLVSTKCFSLHRIKRGVNSFMKETKILVDNLPVNGFNNKESGINTKPDGVNVHEMYNAKVFIPGQFKLDPHSYSLKPAMMMEYHRLSCPYCCNYSIVQPDCYFSTMIKCITHGWDIPCNYRNIQPLYSIHGNYDALRRYPTSCDIEFQDMIQDNVVIECDRRNVKFLTPMNAIIKNSDKIRAKVLVHTTIVDQLSLNIANEKLLSMNQPKIKVRLAVDHTGTGLNAQTYTPAFRYPNIGHALSLVTRNCYMALGDAQRYFHSFPTSINHRYYFCVEYGGKVYCYTRCSFGGSCSPYYISTWSAEFKRWLKYVFGIDSSHIVDDWFIPDSDKEVAKAKMDTCSYMFHSIGLTMNPDKFKLGQQVIYLGILIDSETMTLRFEATQSTGFRLQLEYYLSILLSNDQIQHSAIRPICGKLNWYAEIIQSGRLHIQTWWLYEKHGKHLYLPTKLKLISDTQWWISLLKSWETNQSHGYEYRILSADRIFNEPFTIYVIQSDASGSDGFGYYHSWLDEVDSHFVSKQWPSQLDSSIHSMLFELYALEDFLQYECYCYDCILIWITDSESASYSINKGNCKDPASHTTLSNILYLCDVNHIEILALWVPREENQLADYLSHLSTYINRDIKGNLSDLIIASKN